MYDLCIYISNREERM